METQNKLNDLLKETLSVNNVEVSVLPLESMSEARVLVAARSKAEHKSDLFWLLANFLNLKIKLYHAFLFLLIAGTSLYFATRDNRHVKEPTAVDKHEYNVSSASSSTLMASIKTFCGKDKN